MTDDDGASPPLGETWRDRGVAVVRGAVGMVPVAGSICAEIVGQMIPNQRLDRLETYLRYLNGRLEAFDDTGLRARLIRPESVDLFEDGVHQAVRSLSDERKRYIAELVASGMTSDNAEQLRSKRLLGLLAAIDDDQIIILTSELHKHQTDQEFHNLHRAVLEPRSAHLGSGRDELDAATAHREARMHLARLGLLQPQFKKPRRGELPEFDENTGMMKASGYKLTSLGVMLLKRIGLANENDL